jgi:hypothetical protein
VATRGQGVQAGAGRRLQAPPAALGPAPALELVVVEHGLAGRGDRDQPEAVAGGGEGLGHLGPVDRVDVLEGEAARGGQGDPGDLAAPLVGHDHRRVVPPEPGRPGHDRHHPQAGHHQHGGEAGSPGGHAMKTTIRIRELK